MIQRILDSHLTNLERGVNFFADDSALWVPDALNKDGTVQRWRAVTFRDFYKDVEKTALYWDSQLKNDGINQGAVVTLWLSGTSYRDLVYIYAISRAGYIPHAVISHVANSTGLLRLAAKANASALIYDNNGSNLKASDCTIPFYLVAELESLPEAYGTLPPISNSGNPQETLLIFSTSGSTSGTPKPVFMSRSWLDFCITKTKQFYQPFRSLERDVTNRRGSFFHLASFSQFLGSVYYGSSLIMTTYAPEHFTPAQIKLMVHQCGLKSLTLFRLTVLPEDLRINNYELLQTLDVVRLTSTNLIGADAEWAFQNSIRLQIEFGMTECGTMLSSSISDESQSGYLLHLMDGVSYSFRAIDGKNTADDVQLLELVVLADSSDCPAPSLRSSDGHFHTGDYFEEVEPNRSYVFRGRAGDWVKTIYGKCDTLSIEEYIWTSCDSLIASCAVIGTGRIAPTVIVERAHDFVDGAEIRARIMAGANLFNSQRYLHEHIREELIIDVQRGTLPKSGFKMNVRREAVEDMFKSQLDELYNKCIDNCFG